MNDNQYNQQSTFTISKTNMHKDQDIYKDPDLYNSYKSDCEIKELNSTMKSTLKDS